MFYVGKNSPLKGECDRDLFPDAIPDERFANRFSVDEILKSIFDRLFALFLIIFFAPLLLLIAGIIFFIEGRPIFFRHQRVGFGGRRFQCLKFRSMASDSDKRLRALLEEDAAAREEWRLHHKLTDDPRITCFGRLLRVSSFDELPQLFNVLIGDMSMVGPRPICEDELIDYGDQITFYSRALPGITGAWQVNGRSSTTFEERVEMDVKYCLERNFLLDLKIILKTIPSVFSSKGAR